MLPDGSSLAKRSLNRIDRVVVSNLLDQWPVVTDEPNTRSVDDCGNP